MNRLTLEQRYEIIQIYFENQSSIRATYRRLRHLYGLHNRPSQQAIRRTVDRFRTTYSLEDAITPARRRNVRTEENIAAVNESVEEDPNLSIRRRSQVLGLCPSTTWKILRGPKLDVQNALRQEQPRCPYARNHFQMLMSRINHSNKKKF